MATNPLEEARAEEKVLFSELEELTKLEALDEEQDARYQALVTDDIPAATARRERLEERDRRTKELLEASRNVLATEPGTDQGVTRAAVQKPDPFDTSTIRITEPGMVPVKEFKQRARDAVEQAPEVMTDWQRETATRHVDNDETGKVAAHYLKFGSPEYTEAFTNYMRSGQFRTDDGNELRAALSTTAANGGYLIPFHLDPSVILTNTGTMNPFRQISRVVTISTNEWHGVSSAGVNGEWLGEASEAADASPTFVQPAITPEKAAAYVQASFEVVQDTANLGSEITRLIGDAKDRLESAAFATGTGTTQPWGVVTRISGVTASRVNSNTNAAFGTVDVFALVNALPARYQDNCSWVGHWGILNLIRQFNVGSVGQANFWADLGPGIPPQLLGQSVYKSSVMTSSLSSATASTDHVLLLGDFMQGYTIVDRIGLEVVYNPLVLGSNRRPSGEVGWMAHWRVGADVVNNDAFRLLQV